MKSNSSKPMTKVNDKELIRYGIDALLENGIDEIYVIYSQFSEDVLKLKNIYKSIKFCKQDNVNGSLSTFIFLKDIVNPPFLVMDCDIVFNAMDLCKMLNTISENEAYAFMAVVNNPFDNNSKYVRLLENRVCDFDKKGFNDGVTGGMIYYWEEYPYQFAKDFFEESNSFGDFLNKIVKKEEIKPIYIDYLWDVDTMEDVKNTEEIMKNNIFFKSFWR